MSGHDDRADLTPDLADAFARPVDGPDLTRSIMGRLGYMRTSQRAARRARLRRWAARATTCLFALVVLAVGLQAHDQSANARRPVGPTIPSALGDQVNEQQRSIIRTLETIREIAPAVPSLTPEESIIELDLEGATGPIC